MGLQSQNAGMQLRTFVVGLVLSIAAVVQAAESSFYKNPRGLFSTRPGETKSLTNIKRFGPVGIGIDLVVGIVVLVVVLCDFRFSSIAAADQQVIAVATFEPIFTVPAVEDIVT